MPPYCTPVLASLTRLLQQQLMTVTVVAKTFCVQARTWPGKFVADISKRPAPIKITLRNRQRNEQRKRVFHSTTAEHDLGSKHGFETYSARTTSTTNFPLLYLYVSINRPRPLSGTWSWSLSLLVFAFNLHMVK